MKKHIFMLPFLGINALIFASVKFLITDTGGAIFMLLFGMPILIFVSSIIYGKLYKFNIFYSILLTLIILGLSVTLYSSDLYIYAIIYGILSLAGNAIGFAFHKESGNSKIGKIILGVFLTFLAIIMFLFALNIFKVETKPEIAENNVYTKSKHSISYSGSKEVIDYFVGYDAGEFEGNKSLTFDNKKASEARKKSLENFKKNWKDTIGFQFEHKGKKEEYLLTPFSNFRLKAVYFNDGVKYVLDGGNGEIYESEKTRGAVRDPFKNFIVDGNNWWLLYENMNSKMVLVHNGEIVENAETFSLTSIEGKTFYFFKKDKNSKIQFYLDGKIYDTNFDEIIHDKCCEYAAYNLGISNDGRIYFWGVIGKKFSYNEMILPGFKIDIENQK